MSTDPSAQDNELSGIHIDILGWRVCPEVDAPTLFTLSTGDVVRPVTEPDSGLLIFCTSLDLAPLVAASVGLLLPNGPQPEPFVIDTASSLYAVLNSDIDEYREIMEAVNFLLDCVNVTYGPITPSARHPLHRFADHMTFSNDITPFFRDGEYTRIQVHDAMLWCMGWILSQSRLITR